MKNKNIKFIIIAVAIAIVFAVGLTYAYFSADVSNTVNVNATAETKARDIFIASGDVTLETEVTNAFMQDGTDIDGYIDSIEKSGTITVSLTAGSDTATCNYDLAISNAGSIAYTKSPQRGDLYEYTVQGTDDSATPQTFAEINVDSAMASTKSATTAQDSSKQVSSGILGNYSISDDYDDGAQVTTTQTWTINTKFYNLNIPQDAQAGMNYSYNIKVVNVNCENNKQLVADANTNYTGYYADTDNDGTVDGVIFVDLLKTSNNNQTTVSGKWNSDSDGTYSYNTVESSKVYNISSNNYEGIFGSYPIISIKNNSKGNDRFYVMALSDIDSHYYYWNYNNDKNNYTMDSAYMEPESTTQISMQDSSGQSIGKRNTTILMQSDALKDHSDNLWNHIGTQVSKGWFVPSRAEWSAFGDYAYTKAGVTRDNYSTYGLSFYCWSSSMKNIRYAWSVNFIYGYISYSYEVYYHLVSVRLATTF